ncbi:OmpP1/FadL family transporter [Phocaeicola barnesiae]
MKKRLFSIGMLAMAAVAAVAQTQYDAARFSGSELNGTARFVGMGGAMSALGADISVIGTNPAGIGLFRSHDLSLSFGFNKNVTNSNLGGTEVKDERTRASFDQLGFVYSTKIGNKTDLRYFNIGFNYHKMANFNRQFSSRGNLNGSSLSWQMQDMMLGTGAYQNQASYDALLDAENPYTSSAYYGTPFLGSMGVRTGLVDDVTGNDGSFGMMGWNGASGDYYSREEGGINAYDFNLSFNVQDRFYFGATLGVYDVNYSRYSSYYETVLDDKGNDNGSFQLNNWFTTDGAGLDLKLGVIVRPMEYSPFRIGFAVHTPIWYSLNDRYTATLGTDILAFPEKYTENLSDYYAPDASYLLEYQLATPWKFNVSMGTTFSNVLAVDAEYEFANYAKARYKDAGGYDLAAANEAVDKYLKNVHTFRIGMEAKFTPQFSFRAGYNYVTSPIADNSARYVPNLSTNKADYIWFDETRTDPEYHNLKARNTLTLGLGYRGKFMYADVAYKYDFYKSDFYMFDDYRFSNDGNSIVSRNSAAAVNHDRHQLLLTLGVKF